QHSATLPLQHAVVIDVGFASRAGQNQAVDFVTSFDENFGREQCDDRSVAVSDKPDRRGRGSGSARRGVEEQLDFVGQRAGEQRIFHSAIPTWKWARAVFLL